MPAHLEDNVLLRFAAGRLPKEAQTQAHLHLDACPECRAALAAALRVEAEHRTEVPTLGAEQTRVDDPRGPPVVDGYQVGPRIGQGGMGEVFEAVDGALGRVVALKRSRLRDEGSVTRFRNEARLTADLEHPNIIPVHALGTLPSGEPFYTMKRVRSRTLETMLAALARGEEQATPIRLGIVFLQVVQALAHAHARGIVHCDLKPANVLLGDHGEVLVTDWGLARRTGQPDVGGTPRYLAPERRVGGAATPQGDVWALGAILYELLTLSVWSPQRPSERARDREVPAELEEICLKALKENPAERYADAEQMRLSVDDALSGVRRREAARRTFAEAQSAVARYRATVIDQQEVERRTVTLSASVKPYDDESLKASLWAEEELRDRLQVQAEQALAEALELAAQALGVDPTFQEARDLLADLHLEQFLEAEKLGDRRRALFHRRHVERHHRGRHATVLKGGGSLELTLPSGVSAELYRLVERGKLIVPGERLELSHRLPLARGAYVLSLSAPSKRSAQLPFAIDRGTTVAVSPKLFADAEVGTDFVHVPAGPFVYGGDPVALNSAPRQLMTLDDFFIARFPVTCAEYLEFLNAVDAQAAADHAPRSKPEGGWLWSADSQGRWALPECDADGNPVHPQAPVMGVSFHDALAFVRWRSERDGQTYQLPTEQQWEKAARGADGRIFPWGNGFDPTFCKMALSRPGRPQPEPVGAFPRDVSIYGMRDAAGAIREWTQSFFDPSGETRVLRGGAWYFNPHYCRLAFRHGYLPHIVFTNFGFRLARGAPDSIASERPGAPGR